MRFKEFKNKWTGEIKQLDIPTSVDILSDNEKNEVAKFINSKFYHHNPAINIEEALADDEVKFINENPSLIYKSNLGAAYREVNLPKQKEEKSFINSPFAYAIAGIIFLFFIIMNWPKGSSSNSINTPTATTSETESTTSQVEDKDNNNQNNETGENSKDRNYVNQNISGKYFISDENGLYTVIHFEPVNEGAPLGAMILSQNKCHYSFTYEINGNKISAEFFQSSCGNSSENKMLYYDMTNDFIYTMIGGQKFIFRPQ